MLTEAKENEEENMPLLFAQIGEEVQIVNIAGSSEIKHHLEEVGFNEGELTTVIQKIATGVIVKAKNGRIALDRTMASKIRIRPLVKSN